MSSTFSLHNKPKGNLSLDGLPFADMKDAVLGPDYELSLVFVKEQEMHELNVQTRSKDKPTNILSFPLEKNVGEIYICLEYSKKEAHLFERTYQNYIAFLFIHGLVHLKGFDHSSRMETEEQKFRAKFNI